MHVIAPSPEHTVTTPNAVMAGLAAPSRGSTALSTWTVRMEPGAAGPEHSVDQEQVWTVTAGTLTVTAGEDTETVPAGRTVVLPAGVLRRIRAGAGEGAEALVAMPAGGLVTAAGQETRPLPWAV
ncbi:cupin domain-containing protein [Streptomyces armeniacus]|uniref:Cupin domain-containing protein n=1 Tax=Streptomyces armeniacus TaxID=83291 RepID=A0A345Y1Q9_9ACTN|nr:cupin domain-containing protein [Streptomyces armeniacus]